MSANQNSDYDIPQIEAHLVHLMLEPNTGNFDPNTGEKISNKRPVKLQLKEFNRMKNAEVNVFGGYDVEIIHMPEGGSVPKKLGKNGIVAQSAGDGQSAEQLTDEGKGDRTGAEAAAKEQRQLSKLNKPELKAMYREVVGNEPDSSLNKADLIAEIEAVEENDDDSDDDN